MQLVHLHLQVLVDSEANLVCADGGVEILGNFRILLVSALTELRSHHALDHDRQLARQLVSGMHELELYLCIFSCVPINTSPMRLSPQAAGLLGFMVNRLSLFQHLKIARF